MAVLDDYGKEFLCWSSANRTVIFFMGRVLLEDIIDRNCFVCYGVFTYQMRRDEKQFCSLV